MVLNETAPRAKVMKFSTRKRKKLNFEVKSSSDTWGLWVQVIWSKRGTTSALGKPSIPMETDPTEPQVLVTGKPPELTSKL